MITPEWLYKSIFDLQALVNIFFSLTVTYYSSKMCWKTVKTRPVCTLFVVLGIAWALISFVLLLQGWGITLFANMNITGATSFSGRFIRPLITATLATMAIMQVGRYRRLKMEEENNGHINRK